MNGKLYCMYLRKSRKDDEAEARGEGETLARHERTLLQLAKSMNLSIGAIYKEIVSGETISARPVMQRLLQEVEQGMWDGCLVVEIERLARGDTRDQGYVAEAFTYSSTKIVTPMKIYDPCDPSDQEYFEFSLFMSRREYKAINRRLEAGRQASFEEGKYLGNIPPYGWERLKLKKQKGYTLIRDPKEAPVRDMMYQWAAYGPDGTPIGSSLIAQRLDAMGIKPRNGERWSPAAVRDIIRNEANKGYVRRFKRQTRKIMRDGVVQKTRPQNKNYQLIKGLHEGPISDELFRLANNNIGNGAPRANMDLSLKNPLSGLVYCPVCGHAMSRRITKVKSGYDFLHCPTPHCKTVGSSLQLVEKVLISELNDWLKEYEIDNVDIVDTCEDEKKIKERMLRDTMNELDKLSIQRANLYDLLEQGVYTTDVFLERQKAVVDRLDVLQNKITALGQEIDNRANKELDKTVFAPKCKYIIENYFNLSTEKKNELLKELLEKVIYTKFERNRKGEVNIPTFHLDLYPKLPRNGE